MNEHNIGELSLQHLQMLYDRACDTEIDLKLELTSILIRKKSLTEEIKRRNDSKQM